MYVHIYMYSCMCNGIQATPAGVTVRLRMRWESWSWSTTPCARRFFSSFFLPFRLVGLPRHVLDCLAVFAPAKGPCQVGVRCFPGVFSVGSVGVCLRPQQNQQWFTAAQRTHCSITMQCPNHPPLRNSISFCRIARIVFRAFRLHIYILMSVCIYVCNNSFWYVYAVGGEPIR